LPTSQDLHGGYHLHWTSRTASLWILQYLYYKLMM
jgi:hypothetical protein